MSYLDTFRARSTTPTAPLIFSAYQRAGEPNIGIDTAPSHAAIDSAIGRSLVADTDAWLRARSR